MISSAAAGFTLAPGKAVAVYNNLYLNRRLNIAFSKPNGWHYGDVKEMGRAKDGQILAMDDEGEAQFIRNSVGLPIVTVSREELSGDATEFAPGILLFAEEVDEEVSVEVALNDIGQNKYLLKEYELLSEIQARTISDCYSIDYVSSFLFEHQNLESPVRVRQRTLVCSTSTVAFTFRMYDSPYVDDVYDYERFISSIWIM